MHQRNPGFICLLSDRPEDCANSKFPINDRPSPITLLRPKPLVPQKSEAPQLPSPCIDRSHLVGQLLREDARIRLLIAPTGYGKTTVLLRVSRLARVEGRPTGWLKLSDRHRDADCLLRALASVVGFEERVVDCDTLLEGIESETALAGVVGQSGGPARRTERANSRAAFQLRQTQLIAAGRTSCGVKLSRLTLAGQAQQLSAAALAFTVKEIQLLAPDLSEATAAELLAITEGWPVAVCAALFEAQELRAAPNLSPESIPQILERYFEEDVLDGLSADEQRTLMDLAVFERFNARLVADIPHASGAVGLTRLLTPDLPIDYIDDPSGWYRFHKPFRTYLRNRLVRMDRARWHDLHGFAAEWFERAGYALESIQHAALCSNLQVCRARNRAS